MLDNMRTVQQLIDTEQSEDLVEVVLKALYGRPPCYAWTTAAHSDTIVELTVRLPDGAEICWEKGSESVKITLNG